MSDTYLIERLGHQGDGIAAGPVFVPRALPGERVGGTPEDGRIERPKILDPVPERVKVACPHYGGCGGCAVLHATDDFVADWKTGVVRTALEAQGISTLFRPILTSPPASRRRAVFAGRRLKKGALVGFHGRGSDQIQSVPDCLVIRPALAAALPLLERLVIETGSRKAVLRLAATETQGGLDIVVGNGRPLDGPLRIALAGYAAAPGVARLSWNGETVAEAAPPLLIFGRAQVSLPPGAFLQAMQAGEAALCAAVTEAVGGAARVADLFAGCGTFALRLAERAEVHAVEGERAMTEALDRGWRNAQGLKRVSTEVRDLFRRPLHSDELERFDAVVIDPPRAGAEVQTAQIAAAGVPRVAAVSCNPVTFARDARVLIDAGYALDWVQVIDQFRWSAHVELAAQFTKGNMPPEH